MQAVLFRGCKPEVAAGPDGRILGVGAQARGAAGPDSEIIRLRGTAWPGLIDSHIHLEGLAGRRLTVDLTGAADLDESLARVRAWAKPLKKDAWVIGAGWYNDAWRKTDFPTRHVLDEAAGGRPAFLRRKDGHTVWVSAEALRMAGVDRTSADPPGGQIDRDGRGLPTGILRETAIELVARVLPQSTDADFDGALAEALDDLARVGLTAVHAMDTARCLGSLQRLCARGPLPLRVTYNLPLADLPHAERMG